jgi:hypothetical protein
MKGSARYVIRARSKEEAIELAKNRFRDEAFRDRQSFIEANLDTRIEGMAGFEASPIEDSKAKRERKLRLEWKNSSTGKWRHGVDED